MAEYSTAASGDISVTTNTAPAEAVQESLALDAPAAPEPTAESAEPPAEAAPEAAGRDASGRFAPKAPVAKPRENPVERMKAATAKEAEAKRERDAATRERDEARAEAARVRQELERLQAPPRPAPAVPDDPEPDVNDGATYPDGQYDRQYLKDQARWEARQEFAQQQARVREQGQARARQQFQAKAEETFQQRLKTAIETTPDWEARYKPETPLDPRLIPHLMLQEDAPALMLYLSDHQDVAQRLVTLHPAAQIGEIGKIQGRLAAAQERGTVATPRTSKAPAPITPLGGGSTPTDEGSDDDSFDTYFARFQKDQRARR